MSVPRELSYTKDHEWITEGEVATVGITAYAAEALGDVVFVQLPEVGAVVSAGETCGEIESTKSVSDLLAPVAGTVTEVNQAVAEDPALLNSDPFGAGWLIKINRAGSDGELLTPDAYDELTAG
ncbi:glycine cleavage system protein GcvH [Crossiella sp. CA-258035]|uniref:glycine cleavage system protein GcvH n=1 Tax=Crossiella sp. CA-258035 TaxID=2981138 RepID=UPI0024BCD2F0|nr:glycine cleavage system protein GcvH [Crossiella sp. CA-258035]WHT20614.1 glycine cleavage system protein GcvH [Crossiella sp. CA-258035]